MYLTICTAVVGVKTLEHSRLGFAYNTIGPQLSKFSKLVGQSFEVQVQLQSLALYSYSIIHPLYMYSWHICVTLALYSYTALTHV
jgi:hypothetical protein